MSVDNKIIKNNEIDLLCLLNLFIKNIKLIIVISLTFMLAILVYAIISLKIPNNKSYLPNKYTAKSIVMLNSESGGGGLNSMLNSSGLGSLASIAGISGNNGGISDSALAIKLVTTNSFLYKINEEFNLESIYLIQNSKFPKTELKSIINSKLILEEEPKTGMLSITYTDIDKNLATNIVNKVTELLEEEFTKIDKIRNKNQYTLVLDKMSIVESELNRLQDEIIRFQIDHKIMDVNIVSQELVKQVATFQSALLQKEVEIESYGRVSNIKDPGYIKLINERDAIKNALNKLENGEVGDYPPIKELPRLALELDKLKREAEIQLAGYKALVQQAETLKLTADGTGSTFQVLEYAEVPEVKSGPNRGKLVIFVSFVGFLFSLMFVLVKEIVIRIKKDESKMARLFGSLN